MRRVQGSDVVLAVIGPHWAATAEDRARRSVLDRSGRGPGAAGDRNGLDARGDRHSRARGRRRDAGPRLLAATVQTARRRSGADPAPRLVGPRRRCPRGGPRPPPARPASRDAVGSSVSRRGPPDALPTPSGSRRYIVERSVVTVLGSGANAVDRDDALAAGLRVTSRRSLSWRATSRGDSASASETDDLARVSEHVSLTEGRVDLYRTLRDLLVKSKCEPSSVHRSVARVPGAGA